MEVDGLIDGDHVGWTVGCNEVIRDGVEVGDCDGPSTGRKVTSYDGVMEAINDGDFDESLLGVEDSILGLKVGTNTSASACSFVGVEDSKNVGDTVGEADGNLVSKAVGELDDLKDGPREDGFDGLSEGFAVGKNAEKSSSISSFPPLISLSSS